MSENDKPSSDDQVRADDAARIAEGDAVEHRAIGSPATVRRQAVVAEGTPRAETRGIYLDHQRRRRVVGAGDPIPDGWDRVESATVADRVGEVQTNQEDPSGEETSGGGASGAGGGAKPKRRSSSNS